MCEGLRRLGILSVPRDAPCVGVAKGGSLIWSPLQAVCGGTDRLPVRGDELTG